MSLLNATPAVFAFARYFTRPLCPQCNHEQFVPERSAFVGDVIHDAAVEVQRPVESYVAIISWIGWHRSAKLRVNTRLIGPAGIHIHKQSNIRKRAGVIARAARVNRDAA